MLTGRVSDGPRVNGPWHSTTLILAAGLARVNPARQAGRQRVSVLNLRCTPSDAYPHMRPGFFGGPFNPL